MSYNNTIPHFSEKDTFNKNPIPEKKFKNSAKKNLLTSLYLTMMKHPDLSIMLA